jgi:hypothetical protein
LCFFSWRRADTRDDAFVYGVCGSATIYVLSFLFLGVASDFRYGYWAVLAAIAGAVVGISGKGEKPAGKAEPKGASEQPAIA